MGHRALWKKRETRRNSRGSNIGNSNNSPRHTGTSRSVGSGNRRDGRPCDPARDYRAGGW
ncbi:MAG: hypothetical protein ACKOJF_32325, partial [Planctomycetaceae bacterium]